MLMASCSRGSVTARDAAPQRARAERAAAFGPATSAPNLLTSILKLQLESQDAAEEVPVASPRREEDRVVEDFPEDVGRDPDVAGQVPVDPERVAGDGVGVAGGRREAEVEDVVVDVEPVDAQRQLEGSPVAGPGVEGGGWIDAALDRLLLAAEEPGG